MMAPTSGQVVYVGTTESFFRVHLSASDSGIVDLDARGHGAVRGIDLGGAGDHGHLLIGTAKDGVLRSRDGGLSWEEANAGLTYKNIFCMSRHPLTRALYVGTEPANLFRSQDDGRTWEHMAAMSALRASKEWFFPSPPHVAHVRDVGFDPANAANMICAIEDGWVVRSTDDGASWEQVTDGVDCDAHSVTFMPDNPNVVYCATGNYGYRSVDGGSHFERASDGLDRGYMAGLVVHSDQPKRLLTAAASNPPPHWRPGRQGADLAFYRSLDQGMSWEQCGKGLPTPEPAGSWCIVGDPQDPDVAYLGLYDGRLCVTEDAGRTLRTVAELDGSVRAIAVASGSG